VMRLVCDADKLRKRTGWLPRVSRHEGLRATIEWFADPANLSRYTLDEYHV
jgi:nucleoside-diphosphate-sugar epimerase